MLQLNQDVEEAELTVYFVQGNQVEKKIIFSELPSDFVYFKQCNISSKQMYENLLALHSVDQCNQEFITVDDVYEATNMLDSPTAQSQTKKKDLQQPLQLILNWTSNGYFRRKSFLLLWK